MMMRTVPHDEGDPQCSPICVGDSNTSVLRKARLCVCH